MEGERGKQGITLEGAATKKKFRNSSIELLRLISMLMIVSLHFVQSADIGEWIARQPTSWNKFIYQCVFMSGGWVGNFVFFALSVWFLLEGKPTFRECLKRIWIMERQLLFWGIALCVISVFAQYQGLIEIDQLGIGGIALLVASFFPLCFNLW